MQDLSPKDKKEKNDIQIRPKIKDIINQEIKPVKNSNFQNNTETIREIKYRVIKVDELPGVFKQGKIYVVIEKNSSDINQKRLCRKLAKEYSEFSNIIICLYVDNPEGVEIAIGRADNISSEKKKELWLAFYTYNDVEGEYFDSKPMSYLGSNF